MLNLVLLIFVIFFDTLSNGYLIAPTSNPARHQLIFGLGVPLNLESESVTYGWTVKAFYHLPDAAALQQKWPYYNGSNINPSAGYKWQRFPNGARKKREILTDELSGQKYEKYIGEFKEIQNEKLMENDEYFDDQINIEGNIPKLSDYPLKTKAELMDTSGIRWLLYDGFGRMLSTKGLNGRYCVLRSICEAAESNFGYHNGLYGQLFHIFFTPSSTSDVIVKTEHYDYVKAEMLGQAGEPCDELFHQCKSSVLEIFSKVFDVDF